jgi:hypothetical protein
MAEISHATHGTPPGTPLVKIGGYLAIAGTLIGSGIFLLGCFGFSAAFTLSILPVLLGVAGLGLAIIGATCQHPVGVDDPAVLAAIVLNLAVLLGGLLEVCIWLNVPIFFMAGK